MRGPGEAEQFPRPGPTQPHAWHPRTAVQSADQDQAPHARHPREAAQPQTKTEHGTRGTTANQTKRPHAPTAKTAREPRPSKPHARHPREAEQIRKPDRTAARGAPRLRASRYEKLAVRYLAAIRIAAIHEWLPSHL